MQRFKTGASEDARLTRKYVRQAYRLNPNLPETNAAMALMLFRSSKVDSAFTYTRAALEMHANTWEPLHLLGTNMQNLGLYHQAIHFYDKAIELNPFFLHTHSNRGWSLLAVGDVDRAFKGFVHAYQIQPDFVPGLIGYSLALLFKGKYPEADSILQRAERLPPGEGGAYLKFIRALYFANLWEKEKALALSRWPGILATLGMKEEAIEAIADGIKNQRNGYLFLSYLPLPLLPFFDNLRDEPGFQKLLERQREVYEGWLEKYKRIEGSTS